MSDNQQANTNAEQNQQQGNGQESNQHANAGGQSGEGGFKPISSEADLAAWKAETRKAIVSEVKKTLKEQADADKAKEQGEFQKLYADEQAKNQTLLNEIRAERAERLVTFAATKANALRPDAIYRLIAGSVEYDDNGTPNNIDAVVAQAKKDYPELFQGSPGSGDGGRGNNGKSNVDGASQINQLIRQGAGYSN
jgi:hypothetical protein